MAQQEGEGMKYVITFTQTWQVTEDHWTRRKKTLLADDSTTLGQIRAWQAKEENLKEDHIYEPLTITEACEVIP
jgi:uncharacterized protein (DUF952 family)